jgi:hypothetical protein
VEQNGPLYAPQGRFRSRAKARVGTARARAQAPPESSRFSLSIRIEFPRGDDAVPISRIIPGCREQGVPGVGTELFHRGGWKNRGCLLGLTTRNPVSSEG